MRALLVLAALTACNDHPPPGTGGRGEAVDVDPRYGVPIDVEIPHLRSGMFGVSGKGGVDWFTMWLDAGYDDNLRPSDAGIPRLSARSRRRLRGSRGRPA